jgi:hypothetical protein
MTNIIDFLNARLDEDTALPHAREALPDDADEWRSGMAIESPEQPEMAVGFGRWLAEVEAKSHLVNMHDATAWRWAGFPRADKHVEYCMRCTEPTPCTTLRILASVYADHPDYRNEWSIE